MIIKTTGWETIQVIRNSIGVILRLWDDSDQATVLLSPEQADAVSRELAEKARESREASNGKA